MKKTSMSTKMIGGDLEMIINRLYSTKEVFNTLAMDIEYEVDRFLEYFGGIINRVG